MLHIYGSPLSSPTNKVRYVANYLEIPKEFHIVNISAGEQHKPEFLKMNPLGKTPAINDGGFTLAESNAIIRYLAAKEKSDLYPTELMKRAVIDQWIDYATQHVMMAASKIMFNTYFYKFANSTLDERSLQDGRRFLGNYLPILEKQLTLNPYIAGKELSLADMVLLAALDVCELIAVDLKVYPKMNTWRKKLMSESFYTRCHESYEQEFKKSMSQVAS